MISIITGDIINSRKAEKSQDWLTVLKDTLSKLGSHPKEWEIFRGDSFQLEVKDVHQVFWHAIYIKACIKTIAGLDVRMGIGMGTKDHFADRISEANGDAFVNSGSAFEQLESERQNLLIKTSSAALNQELNTCFAVALLVMDQWTANSAEAVKSAIENPSASQTALGGILGVKQNTVSERQKRAGLREIENFDKYVFRKKIDNLLK